MSDAQALDHFRQATFASPGDSLARYHYAHLLYQNGSAKRALVQLNILMAELSSLQAELFLSDGETRVAELLRAVRQFRELLL